MAVAGAASLAFRGRRAAKADNSVSTATIRAQSSSWHKSLVRPPRGSHPTGWRTFNDRTRVRKGGEKMVEAALSAAETALENQRIGALQIRVAMIGGLVAMLDAWDVNAIGVSVP